MFNEIFSNKKILVTGNTGFKGSWLALWLTKLGARVTGISLPAPLGQPSHFDLLNLDMQTHLIDIRDEMLLMRAVTNANPDIIFHLAAQSLVGQSYLNPLETWTSNVIGSANLLNASRSLSNLSTIVVVTSDKCYENKDWDWGYREIDSLGGLDPYSASKAACEFLVDSYRNSYFMNPDSPKIVTVRAGNVIGGGDWSKDRIIPDLVKSTKGTEGVMIRNLLATRPWQHILDCLSGYLLLAQNLVERDEDFSGAWNFGPDHNNVCNVMGLVEGVTKYLKDVKWSPSTEKKYYEALSLSLDSSKAKRRLDWKSMWNFDESIKATIDWYKAYLEDGSVLSENQFNDYISTAKIQGVKWAVEAVDK